METREARHFSDYERTASDVRLQEGNVLSIQEAEVKLPRNFCPNQAWVFIDEIWY